MVREIEFRGKSKRDGKWVYGYLVARGDKSYIISEIEVSGNFRDGIELYAIEWYEVIPETVGQFIRLYDKNNKGIYEGDILIDKQGNVGYTLFLQQELGYVVVYKSLDIRLGHRSRGSAYKHDMLIEVIGNIHDNKELLEGTK
ncbi:MAG: YopX family protein [Bacilli bacterium]|nr:YopX family protein [Bacilli bacterium]